ncbi:hypothetical protein OIDMADRAFT_36707 [Oidiodendron maius Zn]|uniref:DUF7726 domain-containing protein n=1 Tax=Oidiodendron maius (strain Zn) TaxID=913774 RepID=A0A0C3HXU4_OIDMZ|nr:hypothetical protein OIDMADRAFT_36707 [Oidiodendron maius Zn]
MNATFISNLVRTQIRNFLSSGLMKVTEFQKAMRRSSKAYTRFMGQNGRDKGSRLDGIKLPKKKVRLADEAMKNDISRIHLEGEEYLSVKSITKVLNDFLGKTGATSGNTSSVFYSSYIFFKKLRISDKKPKSKHRGQMEREYPGEGIDTKQRHDRVWYMKGERPYKDKFGKIHIEGRF